MKNQQHISKKRHAQGNQKGFTLVETLISVTLFSIVMVLVSGAFVSFLKNRNNIVDIQRNTGEIQFAMNLMAKTLRTSEVSLNGDTLSLYDYAQGQCLQYIYNRGAKKIQLNYSNEANPGKLASCTFATMVGVRDLTSANVVKGFFALTPSTIAMNGNLTMAFALAQPNNASNLTMQTAVSLRNYAAN